MARIRSIKPEFFDSPSTAACSPWARLLYVAMWCLADDWGVGPANMKELAAFAFPNDDQWTSKEVPELCKEIAEHYQIMFYTNAGRRYFEIPTWDAHQVTQRKAKRRNPVFDDPNSAVDVDIHGNQGSSLSMQGKHEYGTGEEGTGEEGTGEQSSSSDADASDAGQPFPEHVYELCDHLAECITRNGNRVGEVGVRWHQSMDRLVRLDGYTPDQIRQVIDWSQANEFWQGNILSAAKLREKFDQLKTRMLSERTNPPRSANRATDRMRAGYDAMAGYTGPSEDPWIRKEIEA